MRIAFAVLALFLCAIFIAFPFAFPLDPTNYTHADENGQTFIMGMLGFAAICSIWKVLYW